MLVFAPSPSPHFAYPSSSRARSHFTPAAPRSSPSSCCSAHTHPSYYIEQEEEAAAYYAYVEAIRRRKEREELEEARARRHAQQAAYVAALRERQARAQAIAEYHQQRLQAQREAEQEQAQARYRARAIAIQQYQERQARYQEEQKRQQEIRQQRELAQHVWKQIVGLTAHAAATPSIPQPEARPVVAAPAPPAALTAAKPAVRPVSPSPSSQFKSYEAAALTIQTLVKNHLAVRRLLHQLEAVKHKLETARKAFIVPESLVFDKSANASSPRLAFSPLNRPVQAYEEELTRLLVDLDAISSQGSQRVKRERKALAVEIEQELARLDTLKVEAWKRQNTESLSVPEAAPAKATNILDQEAEHTEEVIKPADSPEGVEHQHHQALVGSEIIDSTALPAQAMVQSQAVQDSEHDEDFKHDEGLKHDEDTEAREENTGDAKSPSTAGKGLPVATRSPQEAASTTEDSASLEPRPSAIADSSVPSDLSETTPEESLKDNVEHTDQANDESHISEPADDHLGLSLSLPDQGLCLEPEQKLKDADVETHVIDVTEQDTQNDSGSDTSFEML